MVRVLQVPIRAGVRGILTAMNPFSGARSGVPVPTARADTAPAPGTRANARAGCARAPSHVAGQAGRGRAATAGVHRHRTRPPLVAGQGAQRSEALLIARPTGIVVADEEERSLAARQVIEHPDKGVEPPGEQGDGVDLVERWVGLRLPSGLK